jgi:hypothetical protein
MPFACSDTPHVLGAPFHFAVCHTACSSFSFLTAAPVSFAALLATAPSLRSITPRSLILHCTAFSRVLFSTAQSTRCHTFLLAGRPFRLHSLCAANCFVRTSHSQSCTSAPLHTSAACMPFGKFMQAAPYVASICRLKAAFTAGPFRGLAVASVRPSLRLLIARFATHPSPPLLPAGYASFCRRRFYRQFTLTHSFYSNKYILH